MKPNWKATTSFMKCMMLTKIDGKVNDDEFDLEANANNDDDVVEAAAADDDDDDYDVSF